MKRTLAACAAIAILNGCGSLSSPLLSTPAVPQSGAADSPQAENLLYVTVAGFSEVYYYSYLPAPLKLLGKLSGLSSPESLCVDKTGNVFVAEDGFIAKYAHGGTKPIATLKIPGDTAFTCSVDPATGDLAVVAYPKSGSGFVLIFPKGQGTPKRYADARLQYPNYVGYDDKSDLFVDGDYYYYGSPSCCSVSAFALLPAKRTPFRKLTLNVGIDTPSTIAWEGQDLAIEDASAGVIYKFSISANKGTEVGSTRLKGIPSSIYPVQAVCIAGHDVVGADSAYAEVGVWPYPKGGRPLRTITGLYHPIAVAVSLKS